MSEYTHSIDAKGRTVIPSEFREALGDSFVITRGLDGCAYIYPMDEWVVFQQKLMKLPMNKQSSRALVREFMAKSKKLTPDKSGRIVIPQNLRDICGFSEELLFAGVGSKIEVWEKSRYEANSIPETDVSSFLAQENALSMEEIAENMDIGDLLNDI